jgi:hypothetical protein
MTEIRSGFFKVETLPDGAVMYCDDGKYYVGRGWHVGEQVFDTPEAARMAWEMHGKESNDETIGKIYAKHLGESMRVSIDAAVLKVFGSAS